MIIPETMNHTTTNEQEKKQRADKGTRRSTYKRSKTGSQQGYTYKCNKLGVKMMLTPEEIRMIEKAPCFLCGSQYNITIITNEHGQEYEPETCKPCCQSCKKLIGTGNIEDLLKHIRKIVTHLKPTNTFNLVN